VTVLSLIQRNIENVREDILAGHAVDEGNADVVVLFCDDWPGCPV
jgi:hypothetical protein